MKKNSELQANVLYAIKWEPLLRATDIGVRAKNGVISLTGEVDSYIKKIEAENAAKNVIGVKAIIENIEVNIPNQWVKTDLEIANEIYSSLKKTWSLPEDKITINVENGWVTLGGEFHWNYQREAAKNAVYYLFGVKGITNDIKIIPESNDAIDQKDIEKAFEISAIDESAITVKVSGTTVTLSGVANSWYQRDEAERIAWKTSGICHINNELEIDYYYDFVSQLNFLRF
jgi:osmotically-inducible protein OsmY